MMRVGLIVLGVILWISAGTVFVGIDRAYLMFAPVSMWLPDVIATVPTTNAVVAMVLVTCSIATLRLSCRFEDKRNRFELTELP